MSVALYSTFKDRDRAERTVGALLDAGVIPEDISLLTLLHDSRTITPNYEPALQMVDAGKSSIGELQYGLVSHEEEGSLLYESHVGAGIATDDPADDVSGPEEMDDSESITEDMIQPARGESYGSDEFRDADAFAQYGSINSLRPRIARNATAEISPITDISAIAEPGLLILGDGPLALETLSLTVNEDGFTPQSAVGRALVRSGVPEETALMLSCGLVGRGAILSVVETVGAVPLALIESIVEASGANNLCNFEIVEEGMS